MKNDVEKLAGITRIGNGKYEKYNLMCDLFEMLAIRISNEVDPVHLEARIERYKVIMKKYTTAELKEFELYISTLTEVLQNNLARCNLEDILGRLFEQHSRLLNSQELTPQCIADLMSQIVLKSQEEIIKNGYITVADSTCGSGGVFLATVQRFMELGHNPVTEMVVLANDINPRAVHMAYIQTSLYGIPAVITQADIITLNEVTRWYTPAYILGNWVWRHPANHIGGRNRDDELLKMMTEPMYAAIRCMGSWFKEAPCDENG